MHAVDLDSVDYAAIDEIARRYVDAGNVGLVVVTIAGEQQRVAGYGRCRTDADSPPNDNTVFEIGSITKVFTTCLLGEMVASGEVRLTDPVRNYLPEAVRMPTYEGQEITLQDLATHTSSLPRLPDNLDATVKDEANPYANYTADDLYRCLSDCQLSRPPGSREEYSNLGMGLLGHALALKSGKSFEELVRTRVCEPLSLKDTVITLTADQQVRLAPGHTEDRKPTANWDLPTLAGAGAIRSTGADMLVFLQACLGHGNGGVCQALRFCQLPRFGKPAPEFSWSGLAAAVVASGASVGLQWQTSLRPPGILFATVVTAPICVGAWYGGLFAGLLATVLTVAGTFALWGHAFGWQMVLPLGAAISWYLSRGERQARRGRMLGWQYSSLFALGRGPRMIWHNGGTGGYVSFLGFVKERDAGVVVLSNSANSVDELGVEILRVLCRGR